MRRCKSLIALGVCVVLLVLAGTRKSEAAYISDNEKLPFNHLLILGHDRPYSHGLYNNAGPIFLYFWYWQNLSDDWWGYFTAQVCNTWVVFGKKTDRYFIGLRPNYNFYIQGASFAYDTQGTIDEKHALNASNVGLEAFVENKWSEYVITTLLYQPSHHMYAKNKQNTKGSFGMYGIWHEETAMDLPKNHNEHKASAKLELGKMYTKKNDTGDSMGRIRHGATLMLRYDYIKRVGYGTWKDSIFSENPRGLNLYQNEESSFTHTNRLFYTVAAGYNFKGINFTFDAYGEYSKNLDRNNAVPIGAFLSDMRMPGYYFGEFLDNNYCISHADISFPLFVWDTRGVIAFYTLYMAKKNEVVGMPNYPRTLYRTLSASIQTKLGGVLPFVLIYGYGVDAERYTKRYYENGGDVRRGNHEVTGFVVGAL